MNRPRFLARRAREHRIGRGLPSTFLFARPSFLQGAAKSADLGNTMNLYNYSLDDAQADLHALRSDVAAIAGDMRVAMLQVAQTPDVERALIRQGEPIRRHADRRNASRQPAHRRRR